MTELDLETRVYGACKKPKTSKEIADELHVSQAAVTRCLIRLTDDGRVKEVKDGGLTKYRARLREDLIERLKTGDLT